MEKEVNRKSSICLNLLNFPSKLKNKKGLSSVITTLIIILLVLVAVGIIWVVVRNVIQSGSEQIELGRFTIDLAITNAYIESNSVYVNVRRGQGGGELTGIMFVFSDGSNSVNIEQKIPLVPLQQRPFVFSESEISGVNAEWTVSVAPIYLLDSGVERTGDITHTTRLNGYAPAGGSGGTGGDPGGEDPGGEDPGGEDPGGEDPGGDPGVECDVENPCAIGYDCIDNACSDCKYNQTELDDGTACLVEYSGYQCGTAPICGQQASCGTCGFAEYCAENMCIGDTILNSGVVQDVFTTSEPFQFSSASLPYWVELNLQNKYVNFSTLAVCVRIDLHARLTDPETEVSVDYVRLSEIVSGLSVGLDYTVWDRTQCGN